MAEPASSSDLLERYGAIERAYCDERWNRVVQDGQDLLALLPAATEVPAGLKERLQLLMAHAYLYGCGDRDSAEDLYQAVLHSGGEASLRQIADEGLQQCAQPLPAPTVAVQEFSSEPERAEPEVVVELAAAASPTPVSQPAEPLGWLQQGSSPGTAVTQPSPVMPWLSESPSAQAAQGGASGWAAQEVSTVATAAAAATSASAVADPDGGAAVGVDVQPPSRVAVQPADGPSSRPGTDLPPTPAAGESVEFVPAVESLVPEVVEEPELIELHQADPLRAEELELPVRESLAPAEKPDASISLAKVAVEEMSPALDAVMEPSIQTQAAEPVRIPVGPGQGPFSGPPEPVAEEDPELLLGLLRVEMG